MNIIFMRHGEATDNVRGIISDKEIYWSVLTENGIKTAKETIKDLPKQIDKMYVSPLPRTIQTAHFVYEAYPTISATIDNRIREIDNGKYSGQQNNEDLDQTRMKQIAGDYFVRFGDYGENKFEIETRLCSFLKDVFEQNPKDSTIMVVSHGSVTSFMKRILKLKSPHIKTGKAEIFENVDDNVVKKHLEELQTIQAMHGQL